MIELGVATFTDYIFNFGVAFGKVLRVKAEAELDLSCTCTWGEERVMKNE